MTPKEIMQFFEYKHLPDRLQKVSAPFGELAQHLSKALPDNEEKCGALRKLLEAKDCAVRSFIFKDPNDKKHGEVETPVDSEKVKKNEEDKIADL